LLAVLAGIFLGAHFATWITSLSYTSVTASVTLVNTHPLWVALFGWFFFGRTPTLAVLFGILLAVAGGSIIGFGDLSEGSDPLLGDALAVCGAIFIAGYFLLGRTVQRLGLHLNAYVGIAYGVAALLLLPLPALFDIAYFEYGLSTYLWIGMLALVPQLIGHTGINYAIKYVDPTFVATMTLFEPIGASILALILFDELPLGLTLIGALVLLFGILLVARSNQMGRNVHEVV
jgi:drug/metabolite transporter (DMT)-like permease